MQSEQEEHRAQQETDAPADKADVSNRAVGAVPHRISAKRFPWLTVWTALLALATVGLGAAALWNDLLIQGQLPVIEGQLAEMQADRRPWVDIGIFPNGPFNIDEAAPALSVKVALRNFGKSPALNVIYYAEVIPRPPSSPDIAVEREKVICDQLSSHTVITGDGTQKKLFTGFILFPERPIPGLNDTFHMPQKDAAQWKSVSKNFIPAIAGCADYMFTFSNVHHHTGFIYEIDERGGDGIVMVDPTKGNVSQEKIMLQEAPFMTPDVN